MIDWTSLSPKEIWELLDSAPKVAGPWIEDNGVWTRKESQTTYGEAARIYSPNERTNAFLWYISLIGEAKWVEGFANSLEEAQKFADEALLTNGWLVVT